MSAPTGNTNATRWTRTSTLSMLGQIEELAMDESVLTLTQALLRLRCYKQLWSYWKKMWELDGDIMDRIYFIEQLFMNKLEEAALFKRLNTAACFFILRQNYGYDAKGKDELPSHLVADLEEAQQQPAADQDTTQQPATKTLATKEKPALSHTPAVTTQTVNSSRQHPVRSDVVRT